VIKIKERIYEQLRAHERKKSQLKGDKGGLDEEYKPKTSSSPVEAKEKLSDFSYDEITNLLYDEGAIKQLYGLIGQGKEADVYYGLDFSNRPVAIKSFRINTTSHNFQSLNHKKLTDTGKLEIATNLCTREYLNLHYMYEAGVQVPEPYERYEFVYTMQLLGTIENPDPLLRNVDLVQIGFDPIDVYDEILQNLDLMFNKAKMVHGDFSEHNIVWSNDKPWIIDVFQSERWHPKYDTPNRIFIEKALPTLYKDIKTINNHFIKKYRVGFNIENVYSEIKENKSLY
jgi:RIO kinase 1